MAERQTTVVPRRDIRAYSCPDCGLTIHEDSDTGPWDERYLEELDNPVTPGCPMCIYQVMMEPVWLIVRPRTVVGD